MEWIFGTWRREEEIHIPLCTIVLPFQPIGWNISARRSPHRHFTWSHFTKTCCKYERAEIMSDTYWTCADTSCMLTAVSIPSICTSVNRIADVAVTLVVHWAGAGDICSILCALSMVAAATVVVSTLVNHYIRKGHSVMHNIWVCLGSEVGLSRFPQFHSVIVLKFQIVILLGLTSSQFWNIRIKFVHEIKIDFFKKPNL